jgi:hypothetical protein
VVLRYHRQAIEIALLAAVHMSATVRCTQSNKMPCEEKVRLLEAYQGVTEQYSAAVRELRQKMGTLSKPDYDALYRMTEALRHDSMLAQERYETHVMVHCC